MQNTQNTVRRIHSIQPYLVLKTDSFCQHLLSSYGISHFYSFSTGCGADTAVSLVPDGCSNILFAYGKDSMTADVYGSTVDKQEITFSPCTDYFGIRFFAGENPCFENFPVKELVNCSTSLRDFPDMAHMFTRMSGEETFNGRMSTFLDEYGKYVENRNRTQHDLFRQICAVIAEKDGLLTIGELEILTGYSARYINYIFESESGMSAKQYSRILKLQNVISCMNTGTVGNISKVAEDYHFYDQSHFIHDFERFTGEVPKQYLNEVIRRQYRRCVTDV